MKTFFFIIITLHALIHLLGFLKVYGFAEINQLTQPISKLFGVLWLFALLLLLAADIQFILDSDLWWAVGIVGAILSQILIIVFWQDAKFGTIPNIIILLVAIVAFADWSFNRDVKNEIVEMFARNSIDKKEILSEDMIIHLPPIVQRWLKNSGCVGKEMIHTVRLKQRGEMKMKPEQDKWYEANAEQYFTVDN